MSIDPYYKELKDGLPMPDGTVVPSKNDYYRANESKESFVKRLRDAQKHYMDSTNPKHPNYSPEMCEYFRGKAHGLMIAADFVESWLSDY